MDLTGKWALIRRGACPFDFKAYYAQQAGATGVIIVNHYALPAEDSCSVSPINGTTFANLITIPCFFICREAGEYFDAGFQSGQPVQGCFLLLSCVTQTIPSPTSTGVSVNTSIHWTPSSGNVDGYHLSLGVTPGGAELLNNQTVTDTFYQPAQPLPPGDTVYVRIAPFNGVGEASGCQEYWFVTAGSGCNPVSDSLELVKFYYALDGPNWSNQGGWLQPGLSIGGWDGVNTNAAGCVQSVILSGKTINGVLPELNLPALEVLAVTNASLYDTLPTFSQLPALRRLYLTDNQLDGPIPLFNQNLNLEVIDIDTNQFSGTIPSYPHLKQLFYLDLNHNALSGSIPAFDSLFQLEYLDLNSNQLSGSIPGFSSLNKLKFLGLADNQLTGPLPAFQDLQFLERIYVNNNHLSGPLPLLDQPGLIAVGLDRNRFTFDGLEALVNQQFPEFSYSPQDSVFHDTAIFRIIGQNLDFSLDFDENVPNNHYEWFKDGSYKGAQDQTGNNNLVINNLQAADAGMWQVEVGNPGASALFLKGRKITLQLTSDTMLPCVALTTPIPTSTGVALNTTLRWSKAPGADGYRFTMGTTPGGGELVNNQVVPDTFFQPAQPLPASTLIYVRVVPFNAAGAASGCGEFTFATEAASGVVVGPPCIQWQRTIGGNGVDYLLSTQQTSDGGYILGGYSVSSMSGDKTEDSQGFSDYWVVKLDGAGSIQWQNTIGGNDEDELTCVQQTSEGGYILGGISSSNISGDKTEDKQPGDFDIWVVKLNDNGDIQWQNNIGGYDWDWLSDIQQTTDHGFILGGASQSGIGGDKSEINLGGYDYWVVKLNTNADIQWQNTIGGNNWDWLSDIQQTTDGGFILGGFSNSSISGDKNENSRGDDDYWVVKLDSDANILWQKTIGGVSSDGLNAVQQTTDGGYILAGRSNSSIGGEKIKNGQGGSDYWVVKSDAAGNVMWQNTIGGIGNDNLHSIQQTVDGGYILGGSSDSNFSGDKTGDNLGHIDYWIIKLDVVGNIQWQRTIGGNNDDFLSSIHQTLDKGYILGGYSQSNISGDKTENSRGSSDYWVLKLSPENPTLPTAAIAPAAPILCTGNSASLDAGSGFTKYQWSNADTTRYAGIISPGIYTVTITDNNGCTATASTTVTVDASGLDCGLIAHYPLDGNAQDTSGNNLHGQNFGATPAQDRFDNCGRAMYFNNTWIGVPHDERLNFTGDFSFAFWFKKEGNTFGHIFGKGRDNQNSYYFTANNGPNQDFDAFSLYNTPQTEVLSIPPAEPQKWHHAVCIYEKTGMMMYLYIDGLLAGTRPVATPFSFDNVHPLVLGRHCTNANGCGSFPYFFNGWIDEVRLYNRALRPAEITELYNQPNNNPNLPDAVATGGNITCLSPVVQLQGSSATPGVAYAWSGPNGFMFNGQNPVVNTPGTYTLTVTNPAGGCTATVTATVTGDNSAPSATIAAPAGFQLNCTVASVALQVPDVSGYTYNWSGGLGSNPAVSVAQPGVYTVTVTNTANSCSATGTAAVTLNTTPPEATAFGGTLSCGQNFVILQGNSGTPNATFAWTGPNGFSITQQNPPVNVAGVYTLTVTNPVNGCTASATANVSTNYTPPSAAITAPAGLDITCVQANVLLQGQSAPNAQYAWAGPNGFSSAGQSAVATAPGTYTLTVINPANGCTATATASVGVNQTPPVAQVTPASAVLTCAQPAATLQASGGFAYAWSGPNGFAFAADKPVVNAPGVYTVTVTGSGNGCTATASAAITDNKTLPGAAASAGVITCIQSSPALQGSSPTAGVDWNWAGPHGFSSTQQNPAAGSPGTYVLTVTNPANGCSSQASVLLTQDVTPPGLTATGGRLSCQPPPTAFLQSSSGTPGVSFQWSGPGGFQSGSANPAVNLTGLYTCTATNPANGCTATQEVIVEPPLTLQTSVSGKTKLCPGGTLTLAASGGFAGYSWSNGAGTVSNPVTQTGVYTVTVTDANQCTGTASTTVTAAQPPSPVITGPPAVCTGSSALLNAGSGYTAYAWSTGASNAAISVNAAGTYAVTVTDGNGCTGSAFKDLTLAAPPNPGAGSNSPLCADQLLKLFSGGNPGWSYAWSGPNGYASTLQNPLRSPATPAMSGLYTVTVTDGNQCTGTSQVDVTVFAAYLTESDTLVCPDNKLLNGLPATSDTTLLYMYKTVGAGCDSLVMLDVKVLDYIPAVAKDDDTFLLPGETTLTLTVTANDQVNNNWSLSINIPPAYGNAGVLDRDHIQYTRTGGGQFLSDKFQYVLCPLGNCPGACDSAFVFIRLQAATLDEIGSQIPNGFFPESTIDSNRVFDPVFYLQGWGIEVPPDNIRFLVFNRWGELVHSPSHYAPWDGRHNDHPLPQGTYYYRLIFIRDDKEEVLEGPVHLLR